MKSARDAHGEIYELVGIISLAFLGYMLSYLIPSGSVRKVLGIEAPCLGLALFGGVIYVFWISLAKEVFGKWRGVIVSALTVSFLLISEPWYGVTTPYYFGIFGFLSFLAMGFLTEVLNGGFGIVSCVLINWFAFVFFKGVSLSPSTAVVLIAISFVVGYAFDRLAKKVSEVLISQA